MKATAEALMEMHERRMVIDYFGNRPSADTVEAILDALNAEAQVEGISDGPHEWSDDTEEDQ